MVTITCANSGSYTNIRLVVNSVRGGSFSYSLSFSGGSGSPIRGTIPSATDAQNLVSLLSNAIRSQGSLDAAVKSSALTAIRAHRDDLNPLFGTARTTAPAPVPPRPVPVVAPSPRVVSPPPVAQRPAVRPTAVSPPAPSRPAPVTARPVATAPLPSPAPVRTTEITDPLSNSARLSAYLDDFRENPQRNFAQLRSNYQNFANDLQNPRARVNLINAILSTPQGALYLGSPNAQIPTDLGNPSLDSLKSFVSTFLRNPQNIPPNARSAIAQILPPTGSLSDQQLLLASFAFLCASRNSSFNQFLTSVQSTVVTAPPQVVAPPPVVVPAPSPTPEPAPQTLDPTATSILTSITSGTLTRSSLDQIRNYSSVSDLLMQRVYESLQVSSHPLSSQLRSFRRTHADSPTSLGQFVQSLASSNSRYAQDLQALSTNVLHQDPNFFRDGSFLRLPDSTKYTLMALSIASWRFTSTNLQVNDRPWAQVTAPTPTQNTQAPPRIAW